MRWLHSFQNTEAAATDDVDDLLFIQTCLYVSIFRTVYIGNEICVVNEIVYS